MEVGSTRLGEPVQLRFSHGRSQCGSKYSLLTMSLDPSSGGIGEMASSARAFRKCSATCTISTNDTSIARLRDTSPNSNQCAHTRTHTFCQRNIFEVRTEVALAIAEVQRVCHLGSRLPFACGIGCFDRRLGDVGVSFLRKNRGYAAKQHLPCARSKSHNTTPLVLELLAQQHSTEFQWQ